MLQKLKADSVFTNHPSSQANMSRSSVVNVTMNSIKGIRRLSTTVTRNIRASFAMSPSECGGILPPAMLKLYTDIHEWARQSTTFAGQTWKIPSDMDGEEFSFMMNLSLNVHHGNNGKWQVVFSINSRCIFVRRYRPGEFRQSGQVVPELHVVGIPKVITTDLIRLN